MRPSYLMKKILIGMLIMCAEDIISLWITNNIHIVAKLSMIDLLNSETLLTLEMLIDRSDGKNFFWIIVILKKVRLFQHFHECVIIF